MAPTVVERATATRSPRDMVVFMMMIAEEKILKMGGLR
jgi:hypothetical protein